MKQELNFRLAMHTWRRKPARFFQELLGHSSSKTTEIHTQVSKNTIGKIRNPVDDFLNKDGMNIKKIYKQLYIFHQFGRIYTIVYTQMLYAIKKMRLLIIILTFGLLTNLYGQTSPALEEVLTRELPASSTKDGRWVFYSDKANIEKIDKPLVKAVIPNYDFYKVTLKNYLGYHINQGTCVVLFDSLKSSIVLVEPIWYGGISKTLIKLFIKKQFDSKDTLLSFLKELNELMEIGSGYKFVNTSSSENLITYDLVYFKGDTYTTGGNGISSTIQYNKNGVWRQIEIEIKDLKLKKYISINPRLKDDKEFKKDYRIIIK